MHSSIEIPNASRADSQSEKALAIKADDFFRALLGVNEDAPMFDMMVETLANAHDVTPDYVKAPGPGREAARGRQGHRRRGHAG